MELGTRLMETDNFQSGSEGCGLQSSQSKGTGKKKEKACGRLSWVRCGVYAFIPTPTESTLISPNSGEGWAL